MKIYDLTFTGAGRKFGLDNRMGIITEWAINNIDGDLGRLIDEWEGTEHIQYERAKKLFFCDYIILDIEDKRVLQSTMQYYYKIFKKYLPNTKVVQYNKCITGFKTPLFPDRISDAFHISYYWNTAKLTKEQYVGKIKYRLQAVDYNDPIPVIVNISYYDFVNRINIPIDDWKYILDELSKCKIDAISIWDGRSDDWSSILPPPEEYFQAAADIIRKDSSYVRNFPRYNGVPKDNTLDPVNIPGLVEYWSNAEECGVNGNVLLGDVPTILDGTIKAWDFSNTATGLLCPDIKISNMPTWYFIKFNSKSNPGPLLHSINSALFIEIRNGGNSKYAICNGGPIVFSDTNLNSTWNVIGVGFYIDEKIFVNDSISRFDSTGAKTLDGLALGISANGSKQFDGLISSVCIIQEHLSLEEVTAIRNNLDLVL